MNRPDIAAFVLAANAAWMLVVASVLHATLRRLWSSAEAELFRTGMLCMGVAFAAGAIIVKVAL